MTRAELIQICEELDIDFESFNSLEDVADAIRKKSDRKFNKSYHISADSLSNTLKRFLVNEYDYKILDKDGKDVEI